MPTLALTPDELLETTRAVRRRLDLSRPVEREVIEECLLLAQQAPTGSNRQNWHFIVVTDQAKRDAIGELYRKGWYANYAGRAASAVTPAAVDAEAAARQATAARVTSSAQYLADHMHEVPVLLIPCITGRTDGKPAAAQAGVWGSILPAVWSFMLAARARGLGTCWTTLHLGYEREAADVLGIPYDEIMQTALIPLAYTTGTDFQPGARGSLGEIIHWEQW